MPVRRTHAFLAALAALALAAVAASALALRPAAEREMIAQGRALYALHCAACHGVDLEGAPDWEIPDADGRMPAPPHDASGHTWHHPDRELMLMIREGMDAVVPGYESDMPAFGSVLDDAEIAAVLAFIKSTWPARERAYQAERTRADEARSSR